VTIAELPFAVSVYPRNGSAAVVHLSGEVDVVSARELRACFSELLAANLDVVVDLADVSFLDSTGINVLVGAHRRSVQLGNSFVMRSPTDSVSTVFEITNTDQVFTIEPAD
jgi:anti-sigma B factor antagonist